MTPRLSRLLAPLLQLSIVVILVFPSCKVWNPNQIYKFPANHNYDDIPISAPNTYLIAPGDLLQLFLFTNNGYKLVDAGLSGAFAAGARAQQITYLVNVDGVVRFPLVDTISIAGLTIMEAEKLVEKKYLHHVVDPWVQLVVLNRRAIVYLGDGQANIVPLVNEKMTLLEVIASAGGIPSTARAYRIKLIRNDKSGQSVSLIDLRKSSNAKLGNILIQANDVLIIDPAFETTFLAQITPFLSVITAFAAVYGLLIRFSN